MRFLFFFTLMAISCRNSNLGNDKIFLLPNGFPPVSHPDSNQPSSTGLQLGTLLFNDKNLSKDGTISCASCHAVSLAFGSNTQFSEGINGSIGTRNSMPLFNLSWGNFFFWDGRASSLEEQIKDPIQSSIEMGMTEEELVTYIKSSESYVSLFEQAFPDESISLDTTVKALAQYVRSLTSYTSKYDKVKAGEQEFTTMERDGETLFFSEDAECFHCHPSPIFTDFQMHNNGLDSSFSDLGYGSVTGNMVNNGQFKTPSLRNLEFTGPYMHDGRFSTIEEVIEFYDSGVHYSTTLDPLMRNGRDLELNEYQKAALAAFLRTLTDNDFISQHANDASSALIDNELGDK